jgi:hypothetical protein
MVNNINYGNAFLGAQVKSLLDVFKDPTKTYRTHVSNRPGEAKLGASKRTSAEQHDLTVNAVRRHESGLRSGNNDKLSDQSDLKVPPGCKKPQSEGLPKAPPTGGKPQDEDDSHAAD